MESARWSICIECRQLTTVEYRVLDGIVVQDRECPIHGRRTIAFERDVDYFEAAVASACDEGAAEVVYLGPNRTAIRKDPPACVLELTDDCDVTCATCIVGSFEGAGNERAYSELESALRRAAAASPRAAEQSS